MAGALGGAARWHRWAWLLAVELAKHPPRLELVSQISPVCQATELQVSPRPSSTGAATLH